MITCPKCGELNGENRDTCYKCGTKFGPKEGHVLVCSCGANNKPGSEFCHECGKSLKAVSTFKKCPNCGKIFPLSANECDKCHYDLYVTGDTGATVVANPTGEGTKIEVWQWIVAFLIPIVGIIMGVCMISANDPDSTYAGKKLIIWSIVFMFVAGPLLALVIALFAFVFGGLGIL